MSSNNDIPADARNIMQTLEDKGYEVCICGGYIRDIAKGIKPKDVDIFTNANGKQILKLFPKGKVIGNKERQEKILTVIVNSIEVSQYRKNGDRTEVGTSLEKHLSTCDLTINSLAMKLDGIIIDNHGGLSDLNFGIIKCVGNPEDRFNEDILRVMRAIRFKTIYGFEMEEKTREELIKRTEGLLKIPQDRIRDELLKMINYPRCFMELYHFFVLSKYLPEADKANLLDGGKYHDEPVLAHSNFTFQNALKLTDDYRILIAGFLHDMGKPTEARTDEDGNVSFKGHQKASVEIATRFLTQLKFSNADIKYITTMIKHHMMGDVDKMKDKTVIDIYNELEDAGISVEDMLIMTYSDNQGNQAKPRVKFNEFYQQNNWLRRVYKLKYQRMPFRIKDLEINGHDIIKLGITDGNSRPDLMNHLKIMIIYLKQNR
jgi:tRNA nucleotidyltransferase (CCA-adding enzyme)